MALSRSQRRRVLTRAVAEWDADRPHMAWQILAEAGMVAYWPTFLRTALTRARGRYTRAMSRYAE